ncbi:MAG: Gfo/Idh/MocA family oxidoreductase [bacterium]
MNKLRIVHVGCGGISDAWFKALKDRTDLEVVGLVDLNLSAAEQCAARQFLPDAATGTDLDAMLVRTKPDLVFDCTVPAAHVQVTLAALRHGCHVLGEKPMADTMPNAQLMLAAARQAGKLYAVMQNRRYLANVRALRRFLESGVIGRVTTAYCDFFIGAHFGGFRDEMEHVLLMDMAIHTFDQARYITGADPVTALAHEWNPPGSWYKHGASAVATFEMSHDQVFSYRGSWCSEGLDTSWEAAWRIIGEKGAVTWDGFDTFRAQEVVPSEGMFRKKKDCDVPYARDALKRIGHAGCIDEFVAAVRSGSEPQTICTDNVKSLAMVHAAVASATTGKRESC